MPFALGGTREPGRAPLAILCDLQQTAITALKNRLIASRITVPVMGIAGVYEIERMIPRVMGKRGLIGESLRGRSVEPGPD